ncbi:kinase-like protein [Rickenella mellea]|uniref:Kinase-like protein n=1 Tax=Rickenella mellea TaxID=50990 RepID=A0A4Y7Q980_9AGAM|nr:kinase-like protein [Rickenella mellea]
MIQPSHVTAGGRAICDDLNLAMKRVTEVLVSLRTDPNGWEGEWRRVHMQCFHVVTVLGTCANDHPNHVDSFVNFFDLDLPIHRSYILQLVGEEAEAFMCLLQMAIDLTPVNYGTRGLYIELLMDMATHCMVLPRSLNLDGEVDKSDSALFFGGFGAVWKARWQGRTVALKTPHTALDLSDPHRVIRRLCREVLLWRQLRHPGLLEFLGILRPEITGLRYMAIVSPWMEHGTIIEFVREHPDVDRISLLRQVSVVLSYLHTHEPPVVHRDVRCVNILINENHSPVLCDFGLSWIESGFSALRPDTLQHGNTRWLAPELLFPADGQEPAPSLASDMYSFGMVVLELFTECPPFAKRATDGAVVMDIHYNRHPQRPEGDEVKGDGFSDHLWAFIEKCWERDPLRRPSASEFANHLDTEFDEPQVQIVEVPIQDDSLNSPDDSWNLTGQVTKSSDFPVVHGVHHDIYSGLMVGIGKVALRLFRASGNNDLMQKVVQNEVMTWRTLRHANILPFYGVINIESHTFSVSPWMENQDAMTYLKAQPHINRLKLLTEVASGLEYLHLLDIVHGDLRGGNILISELGTACLQNIGTVVASGGTDFAMTAQSIRWMPPDILATEEDDHPFTGFSTCSDVWGFGMTILEIHTGATPFSDVKLDATVMRKICQGKLPTRPTTDVIGNDIWNICVSCWGFTPQARPTMKSVLQRLGYISSPSLMATTA